MCFLSAEGLCLCVGLESSELVAETATSTSEFNSDIPVVTFHYARQV